MAKSTRCVEIDVKSTSKRSVTEDGEGMTIRIKRDSSLDEGNAKTTKPVKKQVRIAESAIVVGDETSKPKSPDSTKLCQYFKKNGKCKYENECFFLHSKNDFGIMGESIKEEKNKSPQKNVDGNNKRNEKDVSKIAVMKQQQQQQQNQQQQQVLYSNSDTNEYLNINPTNTKTCKFFIQKKGCKNGDNCPFTHYRSVGDAAENELHQELSNGMQNMSIDKPSHKGEGKHQNRKQQQQHQNQQMQQQQQQTKQQQHQQQHQQYQDKKHQVNGGVNEKHHQNKNNNKNQPSQPQHKENHINAEQQDSKTKAKKKSNKRCMFFAKDGFCMKGDQCQFNHTLKNDEVAPTDELTPVLTAKIIDSSLEKENTELKNKKKCVYFKKNNCRSNESCPYLHEKGVDEKSKQSIEDNAKKDKSVQPKQNGFSKNADEKEVSKTKAELNNFQKGKENTAHKKNFNENSTNEVVKKNQYCSFFLTAKGCFRGEKCAYLHPLGEKEVAPKVDDYLSLQKTEFSQLEKRFAAGNKFTLIQSQPSTIYSVHFEPSDPDWGIVVKEFVLRIEFPQEYPKQIFNITLEENEIYPEGFTCFMNEGIQTWIKNRQQDRSDNDLAFRPFLKWFDRNAERLVLEAGRKVMETVSGNLEKAASTTSLAAQDNDTDTDDGGGKRQLTTWDVMSRYGEIFQQDDLAVSTSSLDNVVKQLQDAEAAGITLVHHTNILPTPADASTESETGSRQTSEEKYEDTESVEKSSRGKANETDEKPISEDEVITEDFALGDADGFDQSEAQGATVMNEANGTHGVGEAKAQENVNDMLAGKSMMKQASEKVKYGTEMKFSHLEVNENVASLMLKSLLLLLQCARCKRGRTELNLQSKKKVSSSCKRCNVVQTGVFHPEIVHQYSHVAGYLHLEGCKAFDAVLVDSTLIVNCLNCSKDTIKKGIAYGNKGDTWCSHCHTKMEIQVMSTKFTQLQKNGEKVQEVKTTAKKAVKHPGIKEGQPLPDNGTCKHYKKSYRWLRFPCCGKVYACDVCHEEGEENDHETHLNLTGFLKLTVNKQESLEFAIPKHVFPCCGKVYACDVCHEEGEENDHEMKFATRMICGYCSKEQPFAKDKPCVSCNHNVTKSKSSHWEGGKGCRNRTTMDKHDTKKTAGLGKTISRKKQALTEKS